MFFAPRLSRHERAVVRRLRQLGVEGERAIGPRPEFRQDLREQLLVEASGCGAGERALAGC